MEIKFVHDGDPDWTIWELNQEKTLGKTKGKYEADFPEGTFVKIISRSELEKFRKVWKFHNPLQPEQLDFADKTAKVKEVGYYHGGDELYDLEGIPGIWHECCLRLPGNK